MREPARDDLYPQIPLAFNAIEALAGIAQIQGDIVMGFQTLSMFPYDGRLPGAHYSLMVNRRKLATAEILKREAANG